MALMTRPPEGLPTGRRIFSALVLPFDEDASPDHEDGGRRYRWPEVVLPRKELPVTADHDGPTVGYAFGFLKTPEGMWCAIKAGRRAERLIRSGHVGVSAEVAESGELVGLALVVSGSPAFASARIYDGSRLAQPADEIPFLRPEVPFEAGRSRTIVVIGGSPSPSPPPEFRVPDPLIRSLDMPDPEEEARRLRKQFEDWQRDLREQANFWPNFWRKHWDSYAELQRQHEVENGRDYETRRLVERMTFDLARVKATPAARRPWWWRLLKLEASPIRAQAPEEEGG